MVRRILQLILERELDDVVAVRGRARRRLRRGCDEQPWMSADGAATAGGGGGRRRRRAANVRGTGTATPTGSFADDET